jgi:hypothetical protein
LGFVRWDDLNREVVLRSLARPTAPSEIRRRVLPIALAGVYCVDAVTNPIVKARTGILSRPFAVRCMSGLNWEIESGAMQVDPKFSQLMRIGSIRTSQEGSQRVKSGKSGPGMDYTEEIIGKLRKRLSKLCKLFHLMGSSCTTGKCKCSICSAFGQKREWKFWRPKCFYISAGSTLPRS